jgi:hypothetical protein
MDCLVIDTAFVDSVASAKPFFDDSAAEYFPGFFAIYINFKQANNSNISELINRNSKSQLDK